MNFVYARLVTCIEGKTIFMSTRSTIRVLRLILPIAASVVSVWADADARRGAEFFGAQGCQTCHAVKGVGTAKAPDLGRRLDRDYTPAGIAARMWSHAP